MEVKIIERKPLREISGQDKSHPILKKIFAARDADITEELERPLTKLISYKSLYGIDQAIKVLHESMVAKQKILVLGDFDTDGATSTTLMLKSLRSFGHDNIDYIIPSRFAHGYGLTPAIAEVIIADYNPDLVITVDNGISSIEGVKLLSDSGIKVIITDHHLYSGTLPAAAAIINPNQEKCKFPSKNLAGVGVVFYFMVGLRRHLHNVGWFEEHGMNLPSMQNNLDLVALGTVADVVKLDANNRLLVHHGLEVIRSRKCKAGISALLAIGRRDQCQILASDLSYSIGPRLNAAGRLSDMSLGVQCLMTEDPVVADNLAEKLNQLNMERRSIELEMQEQATETLGDSLLSGDTPNAVCLYNPSWHQGVIGILASRVKESHHRPTVIFTKDDGGELKGSARSLAKLNIRDVFCEMYTENPGLINKFGGHAMAAGLSIPADMFEKFQQVFIDKVSTKLTLDDLNSTVFTDGCIAHSYISLDFAKLLRASGPWGQGFPEPMFEGEFYISDQRIVGNNHLKLVLELDNFVTISAIMFNANVNLWPNLDCEKAKLVYKIDINEYRGRQQVQLIVEHIEPVAVTEQIQ